MSIIAPRHKLDRVGAVLASVLPRGNVRLAGNLVFNRSTGPGRVGLQSAYFHPPVQEGAAGNAQREGGGLLANIVGGIVDNWVAFPAGHLAANPLAPGIVGALGLGGYQLLGGGRGRGGGKAWA